MELSNGTSVNHVLATLEAMTSHHEFIVPLMEVFKQFRLNPKQARHRLREMLGDGGYRRADERAGVHRTQESRAAYERAGQIARQASAPVTAVQHLPAALLADSPRPGPIPFASTSTERT